MRPDRAWGLQFAVALALVAGFGLLSYAQNRDRNPAYWRCLVHPERFDGEILWIPSAVVQRATPGGLVIRIEAFDVAVRGEISAAVGDRIGVRGHFRASDGRVDLVAWRAVGPLSRHRWLAEALSLLVVAVVAWNFLRHFAIRRDRLQVEVGC